MKQKPKNAILISFAVLIALIAPLPLMHIIYPAFQIFLPAGRVYLTPTLRVIATILLGIVTYALAYIPIYFTSKRKKKVFNIVCFVLTLLYCCLCGLIWMAAL